MLKQKMLKRRKKLLSNDEEIDPMVYAVNMVDCMLVLAVGFLIFTLISMHGAISPDMSSQEKAVMKQTVDMSMGQELNTTPETSSSSQNGLTALGTVYKDPQTGKLIMVEGNG